MSATGSATAAGTTDHALSLRVEGALRFVSSLYLYTVMALVLAVAFGVVAMGLSPVVITSGSMAPALRPGDVLLVDPDAEPAAGWIVTYEADGSGLITHRVVDHERDGRLVTRGDRNRVADRGAVSPDDVVGVARLVVPLLATPAVWAREGTWLPLLAVLGATVLAVAAVTSPSDPGGKRRRPRTLARLRKLLPAPRWQVLAAWSAYLAILVLAMALTALWQMSAAAFTGNVTHGPNSLQADTVAPPTGTAIDACVTELLNLSITVTWTASVTAGVDGYRVERSEAGGAFTDVSGLLGAAAVSFVDTGVTASTSYDYRVVATHGTWQSAPSAAVAADCLLGI